MKLSIVVVNWNTREFLLAALESIRRKPPDAEYEIIVVDNGSTDGSAEGVSQQYSDVRLIANKENIGYARGNNQGIKASRGEYVLLLNPDVVIPEGALNRAVNIMEAEPEVGVLAARLVHPDGRVQQSVRGFPSPWSVFCDVMGLSRLFPRSRLLASYRMPWFDYGRRSDVEQPMGTFLMIRRSVLETVGLLDERFPIFFNDVDWCYRARRAGCRIVYDPSVTVIHYGGASTRLVAPAMAWESRRGLLTYLAKHYPGWRHRPLLWLASSASWVYAAALSLRRRYSAICSQTQARQHRCNASERRPQ